MQEACSVPCFGSQTPAFAPGSSKEAVGFFFVSPCYSLELCVQLDGEGNGTLLQYSCLENAMDGGAW